MNKKEVETRSFDVEVRELEEGREVHLQGYALTFNSLSEDLGFREIIANGALDHCNMDNVVLNFNHDMDKPLARNKVDNGVGSLKLYVDETGLFFDAIPTDTSYSRDLISNMKSGVINKCSFAFSLDWDDDNAQTWDWDDGSRGYDLRTIKAIKEIRDVSIVTNPAYESTSCSTYARAKEDLAQEKEKQKELEELKQFLELQEIENELL